MTHTVATNVPYRLTRLGVLMSAEPGAEFEAEGVLNPASGRSPDGRLWLLPRLVAAGNVSRVGIAEILVRSGRPAGVRRDGVVLAPDAGWERSHDHGGVEDPRTTWIDSLGVHVMSYVAFGPLGPRPAVAVSEDLRSWRRLGPVHFEYQPDLDADLNLFTNKDVVYFPEAIPGPDGRLAYAMLHRPTWDLGAITGGSDVFLPAGLSDPRPGIWISYTPADAVLKDVRALTHVRSHRLVALPEYDYEAVKIGAGPPPLRVEEGWLLIHHGVSGTLAPRLGPAEVTCGTAPGRCCSTRTIPAPSWPAAPAHCSSRWQPGNATAPYPTWCSRRPSRRSTGSGSSFTEWPIPASESPA